MTGWLSRFAQRLRRRQRIKEGVFDRLAEQAEQSNVVLDTFHAMDRRLYIELKNTERALRQEKRRSHV